MQSFPSSFTFTNFDKVANLELLTSGNTDDLLKAGITAANNTSPLTSMRNLVDGRAKQEHYELRKIHNINITNNISLTQSNVNPYRTPMPASLRNAHFNIPNTKNPNYVTVDGAGVPVMYENAFKFPAAVLHDINKYKMVFKESVLDILLRSGISDIKGEGDKKTTEETDRELLNTLSMGVVPSMFNTHMAINVQGVLEHTPLLFIDSSNKSEHLFGEVMDYTEEGYQDAAQARNKAWSESEEGKKYQEEQKKKAADAKKAAQEAKAAKKKKTEDEDNTEETTPTPTSAPKSTRTYNPSTDDERWRKEIYGVDTDGNSLGAAKADPEDPLTDELSKRNKPASRLPDKKETFTTVISTGIKYGKENVGDCSIRTLVKLSNMTAPDYKQTFGGCKMGLARYRYADFMYCKDLGKVSNNHLLTLRKFSSPIGDNIFHFVNHSTKDNEQTPGDIGRLVAWFDTEDNKLEDICKFNYQMSWKQVNAEIEEQTSREDQQGVLPSLVNLANPSYRSQFIQGRTGSNNSILGYISSKVKIFSNVGPYEGQNVAGGLYGNYDKNYTIYTPKNTVQDNHLYEGKLTFKQSITLKFSYTLRAYDSINPRSAFLDLIANILEVTFQRGHFWGGARKLVGPQQNTSGWKTANDIIDKGWDKVSSFIGGILEGGLDWSTICGWASNLLGAFQNAGSFLKDAWSSAKDMLKQAGPDISNMAKAGLKNKMGRPQQYAWHALVSGANVGFWHLTVGNPRNPIMSIGNLIMKDAQIQHKGPLGIDDFPTELSVTVQLEHGKSRDATDISKMYTMGTQALSHPLANKAIKEYYRERTSEGNNLGVNRTLDPFTWQNAL